MRKLVLIGLLVFAGVSHGTAEDNMLVCHWKDGIRLDSQDGLFKLKIGGRIYMDWVLFSDDFDGAWAPQEGTEFRAARLYAEGLIHDTVEFKLDADFGTRNEADLKDVYMGLTGLPVGGIRVGHFYEPFGLETGLISKYTTFMEPAMIHETSAADRNSGLMLHNASLLEKRMTAAIGVFKDSSDGFREDDEGWALTGRVTGLPWKNGSNLVHLGLGVSVRDAVDDEIVHEAHPEIHLIDGLIGNTVAADSQVLVGLETAVVYRALHASAEYVIMNVEGKDGVGDSNLDGFYIQVGYFLTGESRPYKNGTWDRVRPSTDFGLGDRKGTGAWEVAARYSTLDLSDDDFAGGEESNVTLGVNWYLNPNTRMMLNYVIVDSEDGTGVDHDGGALAMRFQVDF
jgi:phosphate-selective porin OprO/OprP